MKPFKDESGWKKVGLKQKAYLLANSEGNSELSRSAKDILDFVEKLEAMSYPLNEICVFARMESRARGDAACDYKLEATSTAFFDVEDALQEAIESTFKEYNLTFDEITDFMFDDSYYTKYHEMISKIGKKKK